MNASGNPSRQPPISRPVSLAIPPASPAQISPLGHSPMANYCGAQNNAVSVQSTIFYFRFDLMATLIVQYLAIYNSGNVPDSIFLPDWVQKLTKPILPKWRNFGKSDHIAGMLYYLLLRHRNTYDRAPIQLVMFKDSNS